MVQRRSPKKSKLLKINGFWISVILSVLVIAIYALFRPEIDLLPTAGILELVVWMLSMILHDSFKFFPVEGYSPIVSHPHVHNPGSGIELCSRLSVSVARIALFCSHCRIELLSFRFSVLAFEAIRRCCFRSFLSFRIASLFSVHWE
jgi:hypothetical protein